MFVWIRRSLICIPTLMIWVASGATAFPTQVEVSDDGSGCDPLVAPRNVHELGLAPAGAPADFPPDEQIASTVRNTTFPSGCNLITQTQHFVTIENLTGTDWAHVWYVADPETTMSNYDGMINGGLAFKIDFVGQHQPLILETILMDGIFQDGEIWHFVIEDYSNTSLITAEKFISLGVGSLSTDGVLGDSSGSIIAAQQVPEPGTAALLGLGVVALARRRRVKLPAC